jgi:hypothetical protein
MCKLAVGKRTQNVSSHVSFEFSAREDERILNTAHMESLTGWWFGTFFVIFFTGVETTNQLT